MPFPRRNLAKVLMGLRTFLTQPHDWITIHLSGALWDACPIFKVFSFEPCEPKLKSKITNKNLNALGQNQVFHQENLLLRMARGTGEYTQKTWRRNLIPILSPGRDEPNVNIKGGSRKFEMRLTPQTRTGTLCLPTVIWIEEWAFWFVGDTTHSTLNKGKNESINSSPL